MLCAWRGVLLLLLVQEVKEGRKPLHRGPRDGVLLDISLDELEEVWVGQGEHHAVIADRFELGDA